MNFIPPFARRRVPGQNYTDHAISDFDHITDFELRFVRSASKSLALWFILHPSILPQQSDDWETWSHTENSTAAKSNKAAWRQEGVSVADRTIAPRQETNGTWIAAWDDLVEFEAVPVQTSAEFWATVQA
jgi:hypothetical protein